MRVFDSQKNKKWAGVGVTTKDSNIVAFKDAKFFQNISLRMGSYTLRAVAKRRAGTGALNFKLLGSNNILLSEHNFEFTSGAWSEQVFSFSINDEVKNAKMEFSRPSSSIGSLEIIRFSIDENSAPINIEKKGIPNQELLSVDYNNNQKIDKLIRTARKNIAFIIPYGIYGGAEVYVKNLVDNFPDNINTTLIYLRENNLSNNVNKANCKHCILEEPHKIIENIKENNYDYIIYYNRLDIYNLLSSLKMRGDLRSELIEIYHSDFVWPGSLSSLGERRGLYKMVSISPSLTRKIKGIDEIREVVPVGVDINLFSNKKNDNLKTSLDLDSRKVIGTVARLSKEKNIDGILDVAKSMNDFNFLVLGDGPEKNRLLERISLEKIDNIRLLGHISNPNSYYNIFDAFLLLSTIEGTPISIIEAMASEVPVFTTEVGSINDLIKNTITGFIIPSDLSGIPELIRSNIDNKTVTKAARRYVELSYNSKVNSEKFLNFFFNIKNSIKFKKTIDLNKHFNKIYCINLDSRPDRWLKCQARFVSLDIDVSRFSAYNQDSELVNEKFNALQAIKKRAFIKNVINSKKEMGCLISHYKIIEDAIKNNYNRILVFEDDVIFHKNFMLEIEKLNRIQNWDMVLLGASEFGWKVINLKNAESAGFYKPMGSTCGTFAYAINKRGMQTLYSNLSKFKMPADHHFINFYAQSNSFVLYPNIVIADVTDSDIRRSFNQASHSVKLKWNLEDYVL